MNNLIYLSKWLYAYCTDFTINLANITGLSYYEVNFFIFILLYPLLIIIAFSLYISQKSKLIKLINRQLKHSELKLIN
jgi:hypothetical protein